MSCPCEACTKERERGTTKSVLELANEKLPVVTQFFYNAWRTSWPTEDAFEYKPDTVEIAKMALQLALLEKGSHQ